jgi:hypothetical protein
VPTLHDLQRRFVAALYDPAPGALAGDIRDDGIDRGLRLGIYRNHLHAGFCKALALEYPVIERLVGGEYFRGLALDFQAAHPSRAGNMQHIGAPFADFLRQRFGAGRYEYFGDVARLEWAYQEAQTAADAPAFDPAALRGIAAADYARLHFEFHPACRLVDSPYPVLNIWRANQPGADAGRAIDLASGAAKVLVHRSGQSVGFQILSSSEYSLLATLARGSNLGAAVDEAQRTDAAFDLGKALRRFVELGALSRVTL